MATQYTNILKLALPTQGELSGTWGDVVNNNITSMIEEAVAGMATINTWTTNSHTLTEAEGTTAESRAAMLLLNDGAGLTAAGTIITPAKTKLYMVNNQTSYTITVKTAAGTGIAIPTGQVMWVHCDGTNVEEASTYAVNMTVGSLSVANEITANGGIALPDNQKATFGASDDLQLYHDGSHSYLRDNGTGELKIMSNGTAIHLYDTANSQYLAYFNSGAANIFTYNGATKLSTTTTGIDVTGTVTADGLTVDNNTGTPVVINRDQAIDGYGLVLNQADSTDGNSLEINYQTTTTGTVTPNTLMAGIAFEAQTHDFNTRKGNIFLRTAEGGVGYKDRVKVSYNGDISFYEDTGTTAKFVWDADATRLLLTGAETSRATGTYALEVDNSAHVSNMDVAGAFAVKGFYGTSFTVSGLGDIRFYDAANNTKFFWDASATLLTVTNDSNATVVKAAGALQVVNPNYSSGAFPWSIKDNGGNLSINYFTSTNQFVVKDDGNVGIGTSTMTGKLNIEIDNATVYSATNMFGSGIAQYIFNTSATDGTSSILGFGVDGTSTDAQAAIGAVYSSAGSGSLVMGTRLGGNVTERARITSSGELLVGKTTVSLATEGVEIWSDRLITTRDGGIPLQLNRLTSDGEILRVNKDGAAVGSIGAKAGDIYIGTTDVGMRFDDNASAYVPWNTTTNLATDATIDMGVASARIKDLYLSGAVTYRGTDATTTTTTQTAIYTVATSAMDAGKFTITAKSGTSVHVVELLVAHNGTTATATEYGEVITASSLATYDVDISGGNVRILATPASATSTTFRIAKTVM